MDIGDCRTAPATPGLLIIFRVKKKCKFGSSLRSSSPVLFLWPVAPGDSLANRQIGMGLLEPISLTDNRYIGTLN